MTSEQMAYSLDPSLIMDKMGMPPDPWQKQVLASNQNIIINCHRQGGKSTAIGVKAAHKACFTDQSLTVIISKSQRQAGETFRKALDAYYVMQKPYDLLHVSTLYLELKNGSRIVSLPGKEDTVR